MSFELNLERFDDDELGEKINRVINASISFIIISLNELPFYCLIYKHQPQFVFKIQDDLCQCIFVKIDEYRGIRLQIPFFGVTKHFLTLKGVYQYLEKHHDLVKPTAEQLESLLNVQDEPKFRAN